MVNGPVQHKFPSCVQNGIIFNFYWPGRLKFCCPLEVVYWWEVDYE